jgi:hypothetical protein
MVSPRMMTTSANPPIRSNVSGDDEAEAIAAAVRRAAGREGGTRLVVFVAGFFVVRGLSWRWLEDCGAGGGVTTGVRTIVGGGVA